MSATPSVFERIKTHRPHAFLLASLYLLLWMTGGLTPGWAAGTGGPIRNPGFEEGRVGWTLSNPRILDNGGHGHTGTWVARLGGHGRAATDTLSQFITLPGNAATLRLSFWLCVQTQERSSAVHDVFTVSLGDGSGASPVVLGRYSNLNSGLWGQRTFDVTAYRGRRVLLILQSTENGSAATSFLLDDFMLQVGAADPVRLSLSPTVVSLPPGGTQAFVATVTGSANTTVAWTASAGDITGGGTYTAPGAAGTFLVTATSQADPNVRATATVTVAPAPPFSGHPRLLLKAGDLPRLRAWARASNPVYESGLAVLAAQAKADMDQGRAPNQDTGGTGYSGEYSAEKYAELFAFMSILSTEPAIRDDYARRARTCLMWVMEAAAKGVAEGQPFRDPGFAVGDRSRWTGEGFALTVDWIYPSLTAQDKATVRKVFLRWIQENLKATTSGLDHPEPAGMTNDPALLAQRERARTAGNNYFNAHMRNIGLMALSFDAEDDPDGALRGYLANATGAWLYMVDHLMRTDMAGGLPPEGFEYSPQALGYAAQLLLALHTSGHDDPEEGPVSQPQVVLGRNPFWEALLPGFLHSLSPDSTTLSPENAWMGPVYQPAWYGDGQHYWAPDFMDVFGPLGLYDAAHGNADRLQALRWVEIHTPPGGESTLLNRARQTDSFLVPIWYFLLMDPDAPTPTDPRPRLPLEFYAPGLGRLLARTAWNSDAAWFTYKLGWETIDHQLADGNQFEFFRKGEWLTKERTGYGNNIGSSDYHNTLALENDPPDHNEPGYRNTFWSRGSQWPHVASGDGRVLAKSSGADYLYVSGESTDLYNAASEHATDIVHASRAILWLKPDHLVVYDRAESRTPGRFKRFWLNLPAPASISGRRALMSTAKGQQLAITSLLPQDASLSVEAAESLDASEREPADEDPIRFRLRVESSAQPSSIRFLHLLQGADAGATPSAATLIQSESGTPFQGALVGTTAVLFPQAMDKAFTSLGYKVPAATVRHFILGLSPRAGYTVVKRLLGADLQVVITPGGTTQADEGGLLRVE